MSLHGASKAIGADPVHLGCNGLHKTKGRPAPGAGDAKPGSALRAHRRHRQDSAPHPAHPGAMGGDVMEQVSRLDAVGQANGGYRADGGQAHAVEIPQ